MAFEQKEKTGALFDNTDDKKQENSPDYTGTFKLDGKTWRIAGWARKSQQGKLYLSLAISEPMTDSRGNVGLDDKDFQRMRAQMRQRGEEAARARERSAPASRDFGDDFADDNIPF